MQKPFLRSTGLSHLKRFKFGTLRDRFFKIIASHIKDFIQAFAILLTEYQFDIST